MAKKEESVGWQEFLELCVSVRNAEELKTLFDLFFTIEEKNDLMKRCLIIRELLKEEKSQREIAEKYRVSIAKITRGSNALKIIDDHLKEFLKSHLI